MSSSTEPTPGTISEVRVPRETVNDDVVTVQTWQVAHGERVRAGQHVVSIETSKAVLEVESDGDGFLEILHPKGSEVPIGELIGRVLDAPPAAASAVAPGSLAPPERTTQAPPPLPRSSNRLRDKANGVAPVPVRPVPTTPIAPEYGPVATTISRKAQALIDERGIDAAVFAGLGMVREADVIRHLEGQAAERMKANPAAPVPAPAPIDPAGATSRVQEAYDAKPPARSRGLMGDAAASARDRGNTSVVWLAWNYLWRNWLLGNLVRWAPRGVILPLHRMRGVKMGQDVFIDPTAIIETAFPENITIGNDVRITAGAIIMTHIKAPHYLREAGIVPVVLKPVILEDHCFIGVNAVVMPGVTVGKASVVTSGSVVVTNVPPYSMVQGNPAKVIKSFPKPAEGAP